MMFTMSAAAVAVWLGTGTYRFNRVKDPGGFGFFFVDAVTLFGLLS